MKSKKEMKEAMDRGEILITKNGVKAYLDYNINTNSPYVFENSAREKESLITGWTQFLDFKIMKRPKQITDSFKLKAKIWQMMKEGIPFYVRFEKLDWKFPTTFGYLDPDDYEWTKFDIETGQPVGNPKEFTE